MQGSYPLVVHKRSVLLEALLARIRACRICSQHLPLEPNPVFRLGINARLLIVGQAPGLRAHDSRTPWNDASGDRLRLWLGMDREVFYDTNRIAIFPVGLCYPGKSERGDLPPRPECASLWHPPVRALLIGVQLTLLVGQYAQAHYLGKRRSSTMAETVRHYASYLPDYFPLPHPSPRNRLWLSQHPWFEKEVLPVLRETVKELLEDKPSEGNRA